ncbi:YeeE/YedE family protein [Clostridium sp. D2Q-11]|uniref:YeeE/YedE family protein n=1 Tax=Anaeromonas frigoriresistens TaxID=2683708 RepID=A0A942UT16_9FIRM|nr:YeeE/YedE thiosulfate transporter family protein [Anaeromonas frigoriresistens]MBS4538048.1 YeeE/YedE family protein [Anaeromonas frigoriresistens]
MSSKKIEELKKRRQIEIRKKKDQKTYALLVLALWMILLLTFIYTDYQYTSVWIIGLLIGITLQRTRFCFTAGFRDPVLVGSTSILKAIILGLIISTIGFAFIQYFAIGGKEIVIANVPGNIYPVGIHTAVGAVIFGIGMVIAGGCVSGTVMRIGEGFILQIVVMVGIIIGTILGASSFKFWDLNVIKDTKEIYLPSFVGLPLATILQIIALVGLYILADWYHKKNNIML